MYNISPCNSNCNAVLLQPGYDNDGTPEDIDINVYVRYRTENGEEIEGILSNPRAGLEEGQQVRIKYHPKYKSNARLV